jgi:hypothetical protein
MKNPYLTNYGQNAYFWIFFEIYRDPKKQLKKKILFKKMKKKKKKNLVNIGNPPRNVLIKHLSFKIWMLWLLNWV